MNRAADNIVKSRKVGMEHIIMMRLPSDRFRNSIPLYFNPTIDEKSRFQLSLLAQFCTSNSFKNEETGRTDDLHLWLQIASSNADSKVIGADIMLPSMQWFGLASASSNASARKYLQAFGFNPLNLEKTDLQEKGGSIAFPDGGMINWTITGSGKKFNSIGVNHEIFVADNEPNSSGHYISALVSNTVMELFGRVHIQTAALEPFLLEGERLPAAVHRMTRLEAEINYRILPIS
jgi:hypothetical protein